MKGKIDIVFKRVKNIWEHESTKTIRDIVAFFAAISSVATFVLFILSLKNTEIQVANNQIALQQEKQDKFNLTKPLETLVKHGESLAHQDLNGAILEEGVKLNKATLTKTKLNRAKLIKAELDSAEMGGVELAKAELTKANMSNANLGNAHLQHAKLGLAILTNAFLPNADLRGADLRRAELKDSDLRNANIGCFDGICTNFKGAKSINIEQIKVAQDWTQACYDEDFSSKLKLPTPPQNQKCAGDDE